MAAIGLQRSRDTAPVLSSRRSREILRKVGTIPPGRVTTYGDLCPEAPRFAGSVLAACHDPAVPWQRVVRADGSLAKGDVQRRLLRREGVPMRGRRVDMDVAWVDAAALGEPAVRR
jgi:methylated-DNA-protein-cysteine methyltransferase-like protein